MTTEGPLTAATRRHCLQVLAAACAPPALAQASTPEPPARRDGPVALAASWRGPREGDPYQAGVLTLDPAAAQVTPRWQATLPTRAHGLLALPSGALLVMAVRPGRWLQLFDADGRLQAERWLDDEPDGHRIDGHAVLGADGRALLTPQTDRQGQGWLAVRDPSTLALLDRWPAHGIDPHHLLLDRDGQVLLALGGIRRAADGRKVELDRMASALVRLDGRNGALQGRWALPDPRLSLRHMAWAHPTSPGGSTPRLGIALQAEHDDPAERAASPVLAWWDGQALHTGLQAAHHGGYAGDITAAPGGGWVLSAQMSARALAWMPGDPPLEATIAELRQACALAAAPAADASGDAAAVWLAAASGAARWHPHQPPRLLRWPEPMVLDNHWVPMPG